MGTTRLNGDVNILEHSDINGDEAKKQKEIEDGEMQALLK